MKKSLDDIIFGQLKINKKDRDVFQDKEFLQDLSLIEDFLSSPENRESPNLYGLINSMCDFIVIDDKYTTNLEVNQWDFTKITVLQLKDNCLPTDGTLAKTYVIDNKKNICQSYYSKVDSIRGVSHKLFNFVSQEQKNKVLQKQNGTCGVMNIGGSFKNDEFIPPSFYIVELSQNEQHLGMFPIGNQIPTMGAKCGIIESNKDELELERLEREISERELEDMRLNP